MKLLRDQIESLKYTNHLWPVVILRMFAGVYFLSRAFEKQNQSYLQQPFFSAAIDENLIPLETPSWIYFLYTGFFQTNWELGAHLFYYSEWILGVLFLIGFLVRPASLYALLFLYIGSYIMPLSQVSSVAPYMAIILTLFVFGAGRVGGMDYFFYKRQRGLIW